MVKGHNKGNQDETQNKGKGQDGHLKNKEREKVSRERKGRHKEADQSGGTKGNNNV